jgi:hypothetical protein
MQRASVAEEEGQEEEEAHQLKKDFIIFLVIYREEEVTEATMVMEEVEEEVGRTLKDKQLQRQRGTVDLSLLSPLSLPFSPPSLYLLLFCLPSLFLPSPLLISIFSPPSPPNPLSVVITVSDLLWIVILFPPNNKDVLPLPLLPSLLPPLAPQSMTLLP